MIKLLPTNMFPSPSLCHRRCLFVLLTIKPFVPAPLVATAGV
jgi:hypothetical protein